MTGTRSAPPHRRDQPGLVPGAAHRLRRDRVDRLAARRRARRRGPRGDALRFRRLAYEGDAVVGLPNGAERADRSDASRAPALPGRLCPRRRVRRDQRPLGPPGGGDRRPDREAGAAHDPRAARRRGRRDLRADRRGRAGDRVHLGLDEPAEAEARFPVGGELPERARLLALPGEAAPRRLPALPRPDERGQGLPPRDRRRVHRRPAAEDRRQEARAARAAVLRRVRRAAPRRTRSSTSARSRTARRSSCSRTRARRSSRSSGRSRSAW